MSTPCRFFQTSRGCRNNPCRFSHDNTGKSTPPRNAVNRSASDKPFSRPPPGVCNTFWNTGNCKFAFDCRFKHETQQSSRKAEASTLGASVPFMQQGGYSKIGSGGGCDAFQSIPSKPMDPNEAHNTMKMFLRDDFRFRTAFNVYGFLVPIASANSNSNLWSGEDGQLFLKTLATGNGILRIDDIMLWPSVKVDKSSNATHLSFQRGYFPLLRFLASDFVVKSTLTHLVNALYLRFLENFEHISEHLEGCMTDLLAARTFNFLDPKSGRMQELSGSAIFSTLCVILFECLSRFKNAIAIYPHIPDVVQQLIKWTSDWIDAISSVPPVFDDILNSKPDVRLALIPYLQNKLERLAAITDREDAKMRRLKESVGLQGALGALNPNEGIIAALHTLLDAPGTLRKEGPRHNNDFVDIDDIHLAPTHQELVCKLPPYLPANLPEAPHHLPQGSMERIQDIQFRLLREELTAPLRTSVQYVQSDLQSNKGNTQLSTLLKKNGGRYKGQAADGQDSVLFNVYTNVEFMDMVPDRRGISVKLQFDAPPGRARAGQLKARTQFWEGQSGKRLMQGGLIGLVWCHHGEVQIHLATVASSPKETSDFMKLNQDRVAIRVVFFDSSVELRILNALKDGSPHTGQKLLVESPVMFEAIRPFLEALRVEPESIPFKEYLVHRPMAFFQTCTIAPPQYARMPGFHYQLAPLFPPEAGVTDLKLSVSDPQSIENARLALADSRLDPSQATAVIDSLVREISLIQGPPGTGKSFVGIELLRVLINSAKPILMIAFTNHALDHLLSGVLDAGITQKIVRLGSRSADERISQYSIEALETVAGRNSSRLNPMNQRNFYDLKDIERDIQDLMKTITRINVTPEDVLDFLETQYPEHFQNIVLPHQQWVRTLHTQSRQSFSEGWTRVQYSESEQDDAEDHSLYAFWSRQEDIRFLSNPMMPAPAHIVDDFETPAMSSGTKNTGNRFTFLQDDSLLAGDVDDSSSDSTTDDSLDYLEFLEDWQKVLLMNEPPMGILNKEDTEVQITPQAPNIPAVEIAREPEPYISNVEAFFQSLDYNLIPPIPQSHRPLDVLLDDGNVWAMSMSERIALDKYWKGQARLSQAQEHEDRFEFLRKAHKECLENYNQGREEIRRQFLRQVDIVGCTTTGAAKMTSLLKGLGPRIMLVEEAGQVLEAHILGSLVPSVEHMILIGDPLQLRPTLNNYSLSMDSKQGSQLYRFDMSLMERLSSSGFPMSQIDVQRRMRPTISNLIRKTLYPNLVDNDLVKKYPNVRGLSKNVFFLDHQHPESGGIEESGSRYNVYEVKMIRDLVLYLLRQGCFSQEGDIVVLCAYLGQLAKVRDALQDLVAVVIDERDQTELASREEEVEGIASATQIEHVKVNKRVRLRTVDNYQGEEAKVVILSLVRNPGSAETQRANAQNRPTIGFLKSENRTNVALSRAKEGLYVLGNRSLLASKSRMWQKILDELDKDECVGDGFPVVCARHPDSLQYVSEPGMLPSIAPDGGCLQPCDARLECGHVCPYKCHPDDPNHITVQCTQPCTKLCARQIHPCSKTCSQPCYPCTFKIRGVELPCGHTAPSVYCHQMEDLEHVKCEVKVTKRLPSCEHEATMPCSVDSVSVQCDKPCAGTIPCCGRSCKARCSECQNVNRRGAERLTIIERKVHLGHPCERLLYCAHRCGKPCSTDHECSNICKQECRQRCIHSKCKQYCSTMCSPCQKPCDWVCEHHRCPVPCGSVCVRMPCDKRCELLLKCGHRCPSVCGEICKNQICPQCAPASSKESVVDLVMGRTLESISVDASDLEDLIITLPDCGHVFTVETLDGTCNLRDWYTYDDAAEKWTGLRVPDLRSPDAKRPPVCPTCRTAITSSRYGRIYKSADLEILEKNVISRMTAALGSVQQALQKLQVDAIGISLDQGIQRLKSVRINIDDITKLGKYSQDRRRLMSSAIALGDRPFPFKSLDPAHQSKFRPCEEVTRVWRPAVRPVINALSELNTIADIRSAHVHAWQAAFNYLFNQELDLVINDPHRAPQRPDEYAMRMARIKLGQPQPRSDKRFLVEAIWLNINARLVLVSLVENLLDSLRKSPVVPRSESQVWGTYGLSILDTCKQDAATATRIAIDCEAHRLITSSRVYTLRVDLRRFQFTFEMTKQLGRVSDSRDKLLEEVAEQKLMVEETIPETTERHLAVLPHDGNDWFTTNFLSIASSILEEWDKLDRCIRLDTFYQPVSVDEKVAIVNAFSFSHAGHWYNCPNGHTYVIDDCGGAMMRSQCPDCGETIGGAHHRPDAGNTLAEDFVAIARQHGAGNSLWR